MSKTTGIEWCDSTCNPLVGCNGCELHRAGQAESHCYAAGLVRRYAGLPGWPASFDRPQFFLERIKNALAWPDLTGKERPDKPWLNGRPRHIFWCDMSDPFTESVPIDWLAPYLPMLADSPHVHIFCTKRPARAGKLFEQHGAPKNLILLTTVTSQETIGRVAELLRVPCVSVRGVSYEPALGPMCFSPYLPCTICHGSNWHDCQNDRLVAHGEPGPCPWGCSPKLDWVIVGGESGHGARPMHPDWVRAARDYCIAAGVPFFFKGWGHFRPVGCADEDSDDCIPEAVATADIDRTVLVYPNGRTCDGYEPPSQRGGWFMEPVGKARAGRLLDGREWNEMPK